DFILQFGGRQVGFVLGQGGGGLELDPLQFALEFGRVGFQLFDLPFVREFVQHFHFFFGDFQPDQCLLNGDAVGFDFAPLGITLIDEPLRERVFVLGTRVVFLRQLDFSLNRVLLLNVVPFFVFCQVESGELPFQFCGGNVAVVLRNLDLDILQRRFVRSV